MRAYRKGGGEAVAEHVATGTRATLQMKPTGSIAGRVHAGTRRRRRSRSRSATRRPASRARRSFYMTDGAFAIHDLPAGHFRVTGSGDDGHKTIELDLADGEAKTGVDIALDQLVDVTGRVVESGTHEAGAGHADDGDAASRAAAASRSSSAATTRTRTSATRPATSRSSAWRPARCMVRGFPKDFRDSDYTLLLRAAHDLDGEHATSATSGPEEAREAGRQGRRARRPLRPAAARHRTRQARAEGQLDRSRRSRGARST